MTPTFWWILVVVLGIVIGNLWLIRRSKGKGLPQNPQTKTGQDKTTEGAITGTLIASNSLDSHKIKQADTDHHQSPSDSGSDSSSDSGSDSTNSGGD